MAPSAPDASASAASASSSSSLAPARSFSQSHSPPSHPPRTPRSTTASTMVDGRQTTRNDNLIPTGGGGGVDDPTAIPKDDVAMQDNGHDVVGDNAGDDVDIAAHGNDTMDVSHFSASQAFVLRLGLTRLHKKSSRSMFHNINILQDKEEQFLHSL